MHSLLANARALRASSTDAERRLWYYLRHRRMSGYRFRRQMPIGRFVVDFACVRARLIVELDGGQYADQLLDDLERTRELARHGYRVVRFWNDEVLQRTEAVLESILEALIQACPHPDPLPQAGEGEQREQAGEGEQREQAGEGEQRAETERQRPSE